MEILLVIWLRAQKNIFTVLFRSQEAALFSDKAQKPPNVALAVKVGNVLMSVAGI